MEIESVLVTGANRGIGLEFVKQLVKLPNPPHFIFATYRDKNSIKALKALQDASKEIQIILIKMDVTQRDEIEDARKIIESKLGDKGLNLLINNAAYFTPERFPAITEQSLVIHFSINTVGPVMVMKEMLSLLQKSAASRSNGMSVSRAAVLNISSMGGSIGNLREDSPNNWSEKVAYKTSKAALNMAMRVIALTVKNKGILITNMCPGWVKTDMGTDQALLTPEESVSAMLKTLPQLNESHHGTFLDRNGKTIPY